MCFMFFKLEKAFLWTRNAFLLRMLGQFLSSDKALPKHKTYPLLSF